MADKNYTCNQVDKITTKTCNYTQFNNISNIRTGFSWLEYLDAGGKMRHVTRRSPDFDTRQSASSLHRELWLRRTLTLLVRTSTPNRLNRLPRLDARHIAASIGAGDGCPIRNLHPENEITSKLRQLLATLRSVRAQNIDRLQNSQIHARASAFLLQPTRYYYAALIAMSPSMTHPLNLRVWTDPIICIVARTGSQNIQFIIYHYHKNLNFAVLM